ncbi:MAG: zinc-ribbon domain-containing protein [Gammaproteobacteria bacterium]|nr:zinc-ribbon domain-containing protein [Gammaproteobacteria bacterium]
MYTECPSCQTFFKITPNQLKAAGGKVRCGNCGEVFSALDGLVDVVPEDVAIAAKSDSSKEESAALDEVQSQSLSEIDVPTEPLAASEINTVDESSDLVVSKADDESMSFADVEIPGMSDVAGDDVALESDFLSSEPQSRPSETKTITTQEEINQDIDAALDGLFDGNTEMSPSEDVFASVTSPELDVKSELSSISELDELDDLDFGDLDNAGGDKQKSVSLESDATSGFSKSKLETTLTEFTGDKDAGADSSSLSEFERELGKLSTAETKQEGVALDDSSFDLGDSFLDSDAFAAESRQKVQFESVKDSDAFSGDSFILEELDEGKKQSGGGAVAKTAWISVIFLLLLVLFGQFAYLKRQDLATYPELKPVIENLCMNLNKIYPCDISAAKDASAIELLERNVVSHPNAKNALLITSTIENKAEFDQAFPNLILTFSDINQKIIAKRKFSPAEYLSKDVDIEAGMKAKVPMKLMLEIVDPGEEAVNFEFNFQ